jgi:hypothetical protein
MPDGVLGGDQTPAPALIDATANGLLLDIGFGINFSYATACRMMAAGVLPHIISSDVHGLFPVMHDDSSLDYSLAGAFARLVALGMPFGDALAAVTINPARALGEEAEIGTLARPVAIPRSSCCTGRLLYAIVDMLTPDQQQLAIEYRELIQTIAKTETQVAALRRFAALLPETVAAVKELRMKPLLWVALFMKL